MNGKAKTRSFGFSTRGQGGFALPLVLVTFLLVAVMGIGVFSVVMSDLHGAVANQLAMETLNIAEAGVDYGVGQMYSRALATPRIDESYTGETNPITVGRGEFRIRVECAEGTTPPACADADLRHLISTATVYTVRARRRIEVWVRRSTPTSSITGVCGRDGVELDQGTTIAADVASNRDIAVEGPRRNPGSIRSRSSLASAPTSAASAAGTPASPPPAPPGLNGQYTWTVTYVYRYPGSSTAVIESLVGPQTAPATLVNEYGRLTNIPQDLSSTSIIARRVYRTRADEPGGPWFFVAEIPPTNAGLPDLDPDPAIFLPGFIDNKPDADLSIPVPAPILGDASAGDNVTCSQGCANQVDGAVTENVRDVLCPAFLPPPCNPDPTNGSVPAALSQTDAEAAANLVKEVSYGDLTVPAYGTLTIDTPTSYPSAEFHIHVTSVDLGQRAKVVITGQGKVYLHVSGTFHLGQYSWFGVESPAADARLVWPADRVQLLSCAQDPSYPATGTASVRWDQQNRVAALVFAPNANILINQAGEFNGSLYGRYIHINQATGFIIDQGRGINQEFLKAAFQYVQRWYDNPRP